MSEQILQQILAEVQGIKVEQQVIRDEMQCLSLQLNQIENAVQANYAVSQRLEQLFKSAESCSASETQEMMLHILNRRHLQLEVEVEKLKYL